MTENFGLAGARVCWVTSNTPVIPYGLQFSRVKNFKDFVCP